MKVHITTEKNILFNGLECESVTLPTLSGEITILDNHNPIIGVLSRGKIRILIENTNVIPAIDVDNGYFELSNDTLTILVTQTRLSLDEIAEIKQKAIQARTKTIGQGDQISEKEFMERQKSEGF
jgi:F0F1-type ATP synthase epsilon subunit